MYTVALAWKQVRRFESIILSDARHIDIHHSLIPSNKCEQHSINHPPRACKHYSNVLYDKKLLEFVNVIKTENGKQK